MVGTRNITSQGTIVMRRLRNRKYKSTHSEAANKFSREIATINT